MLKHLKEKPRHKIPYHDLSFFLGEGRHSRRYGCTAALRLLVQPYDEDDFYYYYYCPFPGNGAPMK
jgi:hypothetical protein